MDSEPQTTFIGTLRSIAPYTPVPLFAESLRTQRTLVSAILTRHSVSECLTGCVRDFSRLWDIDYLDHFGRSEEIRPLVASSIRHGNSFDLANVAILEGAGIISRSRLPETATKAARIYRETTVSVSFVTPRAASQAHQAYSDLSRAVILVFVLEIMYTIGMAILTARKGLWVGFSLLICVTVSHIITLWIRQTTSPIFANTSAVESDRILTSRGGAALDVHVIAGGWNSSRISVICGYSSQLHALTNIPVRISHPNTLRWLCRVLALVLTTQAALLASVANAQGDERWSTLVWLSAYLLMFVLKWGFHRVFGPEELLEKQPASAETASPIYFSGRRAALVFISMLPVSYNTNRWGWWDVFIPDNSRRKGYHAKLESSAKFRMADEWMEGVPGIPTTRSTQNAADEPMDGALEEALAAYRGVEFAEHLRKYLSLVSPTGIVPRGQTQV